MSWMTWPDSLMSDVGEFSRRVDARDDFPIFVVEQDDLVREKDLFTIEERPEELLDLRLVERSGDVPSHLVTSGMADTGWLTV
jgi:hypothetical protein